MLLIIVFSVVALSSCLISIDFEVNFMVDGEVYSTIKTIERKIINVPDDPTKDGYMFDGWYLDEGIWEKPFTTDSLLNVPISSNMNMSVYAKWKANEQEHVHTPSDWIIDTEATCKAEGAKHKECTECEEVLESVTIEKLTTHTPAEAVKEDFVDSDCKTEGSYNSVVYCSVCEAKLSSEAKTVEKKEHTPSDWIIDTEATCKAEGAKHKECTECEEVLESVTLEKLTTHTPAEAVSEDFIDSDCETEGSYNSVVYCSVCEAKLSSEAKTVGKKDHTPSDWIPDAEATCKAAGSKHKECTECEEVLETEEIEKLTTHTYTNDTDIDCNVCGEKREISCQHKNTTIIPGKSASCTESGLTDGLICDDCKHTIVAQTEIPPSHKEVIIPKIEPECNICGWTEGKECSECYEVIIAQKPIKELGCTGGDWIIGMAPTDFDPGERYKICIRCGEVTSVEIIPPYNENDGSNGLDYEFSEDTVVITGIGSYADTKLVIPSTIRGLAVVGISEGAFKDCTNLTNVKIANSVIYIGNNAFENCSGVKAITLPDTIKSIGDYAFKDCRLIGEIKIPASVIEIGKGIFDGATKLGTVYYNSDASPSNSIFASTNISNVVFGGTTVPEYILNSATHVYSITISDSVTSVGKAAFSDCTSLSSVTIGKNVKVIGELAFCGCSKIKSIAVPDSVTSIGYSAFSSCSMLQTISLSSNLTTIESYAFEWCISLESIDLPSGVTVIKEGAFQWCSNLSSITLPKTIKNIERNTFYQCTLLKIVYYYGSATAWSDVIIGNNNAPLTSANKEYKS